MSAHTDSGRHRVRASRYSAEQIAVAAVVVTAATMLSVVAVAATGVAVAFVAGATTAAVGHRVRQRSSADGSVKLTRASSTRN
jgi:hypothetical protein